MEFDNEGNIKSILEGIKRADSFYKTFKEEFSGQIFNIVKESYPEAVLDDEMENLLFLYSVAILNSTEAVIDKDQSYPIYRLEEDLEAMTRVNSKFDQVPAFSDIEEAVHLKAKELMVKYFEKIFDLSPIGFRLLEQNSKLYNQEFITNLQSFLAK